MSTAPRELTSTVSSMPNSASLAQERLGLVIGMPTSYNLEDSGPEEELEWDPLASDLNHGFLFRTSITLTLKMYSVLGNIPRKVGPSLSHDEGDRDTLSVAAGPVLAPPLQAPQDPLGPVPLSVSDLVQQFPRYPWILAWRSQQHSLALW